MTKVSESMKRFKGVGPRPGSSVWQWSIKVPTELRDQYPTQWAHRCSLETTDLREANAKAAVLEATWQLRFEEQRRALNPTRVESISPELAATLAQRIREEVLSRDDAFRSDQGAAFLMAAMGRSVAARPVRYLTEAPPLPAGLLPDPKRSSLAGLTREQASGLAQTNALLDGQAAVALASRNLLAVLPAAQRQALKLGLQIDENTPGIREALQACLEAHRSARLDVTRRDAGEVVAIPQEARATPDAPKLPSPSKAKKGPPSCETSCLNGRPPRGESPRRPPSEPWRCMRRLRAIRPSTS